MNHKIERFGIVLCLLSILVLVSGMIVNTGIMVFGGLAGCAISVGLLIDDNFFLGQND